MKSATAHVEFDGVSKSYDGRTDAVRDLRLAVNNGEFLTLLGPSGSGKTTCLMMLAGFEAPTTGVIRIAGKVVNKVPPRRRNIGMALRNHALFPHLTVGDNLAFPLEVRGLKRSSIGERVRRVLDLVRLEGLEDRRPKELSTDQLQRVAIARAVVFEPSLVLMDEPFGALDRFLREDMQYEIRRLQRTLGITVVYVTHDQQEAMAMSDRIAVINRGRIEQAAVPEVLYEEPEGTFVARFVGDNNLLSGRILSVNQGIGEVDVGGVVVKAFMVASRDVGQKVDLAIRPERVALAPEAGRYSNEFEATVDDIVVLGDRLRVRLSVFGGSHLTIKIPNTVGHGAMLVDDKVRIGFTSTDCRALAPDGEPPPS